MNSLVGLSQIGQISVPFISVRFGDTEFGLTSEVNSITKVRYANFVKSLVVEKYGSGAVNTYTLNLKYIIGSEDDPNLVDRAISKATDRKIYFTYGDMSKPEYSYKDEEGIITSILPVVDYKANSITYTIKATSAARLNYSIKKSYGAKFSQPSKEILNVLYNLDHGVLSLLPGMKNESLVLSKGWIPREDIEVQIDEKTEISPIDYILYLVSLMKDRSGNYYIFKMIDGMDSGNLPHFEIISTSSKEEGKRLTIQIGYPGSIPVYNFNVTENSAIPLMAEYRGKVENPVQYDYSFRGDLISKTFYSSEVSNGKPSDDMKNWWDKMKKFPISATLTTEGLHIPAEIVQSVYLDVRFFGKEYWHSGEYLIMSQTDNISESGYRTTLGLMRIGG